MSLNGIFSEINSLQSRLDNVINTLTGPEDAYILDQLSYIIAYLDHISRTRVNNFSQILTDLSAIANLSRRAVQRLYDNVVSVINANNYKINTALQNYDHQITDLIQTAIGNVYNEITGIESWTQSYVDDAVNELDYQLSTDMIALESNMEDYVNVVKSNIMSEIGTLEGTINTTKTTLLDTITEKAASIYSTVAGWVDELWSGVNAAYDYITDKATELYTTLSTWFTEELRKVQTGLNVLINNVWFSLLDRIGQVNKYITSVSDYLTEKIEAGEQILSDLIDSAKAELKDALDYISLMSDWRFQFLNIFMSYPELSFMQVLNRDDETFNRFKPYWNALLARLLKD